MPFTAEMQYHMPVNVKHLYIIISVQRDGISRQKGIMWLQKHQMGAASVWLIERLARIVKKLIKLSAVNEY